MQKLEHHMTRFSQMHDCILLRIVLLSVISLCSVMATEVQAAAQTKPQTPAHHHDSDLWMPESMNLSQQLNYESVEDELGNQKNKVVCRTCHGIKEIEKLDVKQVDKQQADFLRGGPYQSLTDFCYLCHQRTENQAENIHILLDGQGEIKKQQCLYCHLEVLETDKEHQPNEPKNQEQNLKELNLKENKLRRPEQKICYGCHLRTPHLNAIEHQVEISQEMIEVLRKSEDKNGVVLPLTVDGQITCVTCHDPHQSGVLNKQNLPERLRVGDDLEQGVSHAEHPWGSVYQRDKNQRLQALNQEKNKPFNLRYQRINYEVLLRLPAKNGALCLACHSFTNERKAF